jgi:hypothetical protein
MLAAAVAAETFNCTTACSPALTVSLRLASNREVAPSAEKSPSITAPAMLGGAATIFAESNFAAEASGIFPVPKTFEGATRDRLVGAFPVIARFVTDPLPAVVGIVTSTMAELEVRSVQTTPL